MKIHDWIFFYIFRFLILFSNLQLISCDNQRRVEVNFDCHKTNLYFQCRIHHLDLLESDKNAEIILNSQPSQAPNDIRIEDSKLFFLPRIFFEKFADIKLFTASSCQLQEIYHDTFGDALKLHFLVLSSNNITIVPDYAFRNNSNLQTLKLDHNRIQQLTTNAFRGLTSLMTLKLSFNKITHLPLYIFEDLLYLETLELNNNHIAVISKGLFDSNTQVATINLQNNAITIIDNGTFDPITKTLTMLNLEHNKCVNGMYHEDTNLTKLIECCTLSQEMKSCLQQSGHQDEETSMGVWVYLIILMICGSAIFFALVIFKQRIYFWRNQDENFELVNRMVIENGHSYQYLD